MTQRAWIFVILAGALAVNAVLFAVFKKGDTPPAPTEVAAPAAAPIDAAQPAPPAEDDGVRALVRARRAAGMAALEDGDYGAAVTEFAKGLELDPSRGDTKELLRIAEEMRARERTRKESERVAIKAPAAHAARPQPAPAPKPPAPPARETRSGGMLLVSSTPPGILVLVDGKKTDFTPLRTRLRAGRHTVAFMQGDRLLEERKVSVVEGDATSLHRDLAAQLDPAPAVAAAPPESSPSREEPAPSPMALLPLDGRLEEPLAPGESPEATPSLASTRPAPEPEEDAERDRAGPQTATGELQVISPGLYGEVWINQRSYGFPPVVAQELPVGTARVEIRVHGEVKRRLSVQVQPQRRSIVRVR